MVSAIVAFLPGNNIRPESKRNNNNNNNNNNNDNDHYLLFIKGDVWKKNASDSTSDITILNYDDVEMFELVSLCILVTVDHIYTTEGGMTM